jgi:hypothetical protein
MAEKTKTPSFMKQIPWYSSDAVRFMPGQAALNERRDMEEWYHRG